jgi:hypothetical protein
LKEKAAGRSPRGSCSLMTMPRLAGHLQPTRNWPVWASNVLITHPILQIWPSQTTTCSLDLKKPERSPFFIQHRSHCCRSNLVGRTMFWIFFLSGLQNLEQLAKKCTELCGEYIEQIPSLVTVTCFLPGRAKDLSAPCHSQIWHQKTSFSSQRWNWPWKESASVTLVTYVVWLSYLKGFHCRISSTLSRTCINDLSNVCSWGTIISSLSQKKL